MGEQSTRHYQANTMKNGVSSCCGQDHHHRAQMEDAMLRFALDRVSSYWSRGLVGRPVYRIIVVLSRGSRVSNLLVSFGVRSNLCILASSFLVVFYILSMWCFRACGYFHDKLYFIENGFRVDHLLHFRYWGISWFSAY